jgi:acetolactate decarboxylase
MFVYSYAEKWHAVKKQVAVNNYTALENLIAATAKEQGYDTAVPFVFKIEAIAKKANYHVIDWKKGVQHTMQNHKQFAYTATTENKNILLLGFYSDHHHSIFTHHTTNMHIHLLDKSIHQAGHLDNIVLNGTITIYLPAP